MGDYRFKLSEMIPNAWFYKLKDLSNTKTTKPHKTHSKQNSPFPPQSQHHHHHVHKTEHHSAQGDSQPNISDSRKSYYIARKLISKPDSQDPETFLPEKDPPRKSSRRRPTKRNSTSTKSSSSSVFSSNRSSSTSEYRSSATVHSQIPDPEGSPDFIQPKLSNEIPLLFKNRVPCSASCRCRLDPPANPEDDVIVSVDVKSLAKNREISNGFDSKFGIELPPIIIKSEKFKGNRTSTIDGIKEQQSGSSMRRLSSSSPGGNGVRLRVNSPRIMGSIGGGRRSISRRRKNKTESFAIVKSSFDPQRDFKESMVEMILENDIKESKELKELLACYLELNSDEYHDMIVKVFKQIWLDLNGHNNKQSKWKLP